MKRFLGILLPTLMVATMAAPLIDIGVVSAALQSWNVGSLTPTTVVAGSNSTISSFSETDNVGAPNPDRFESITLAVSPSTPDVALNDTGDGTSGCVEEAGTTSPFTSTFSNAVITTTAATPATTYTLTFTDTYYPTVGDCTSKTNALTGAMVASSTPTLAVTAGDVVTFNPNDPNTAGASGTMANESFTSGVPQALTANAFADTGYTFTGWNTVAGGGGTAYTDGETTTISSSFNLYAQWTFGPNSAIATFNGNGSTSGTMSNEVFAAGVSQAITANAYNRTGFVFTGWNTNSAGTGTAYAAGAVITLSLSVTLYAQWSADTDNFSYNAAGGAPTPTAGSGLNGTSITLAAAPARFGYVFEGWNDGSATYGASVSYPLESDGGAIVFTAQWTTISTGGGGPSGTTLDQTSPTSGVTTSDNSGTFTAGPITVSHATGAVSFAVTSSSKALSVSPQGAITTTGTLLAGSYSISGTDSDVPGDTGSWTYTLTVKNPSVTLTFNANGGTGSMAPESENAATPLIPNIFTRAGYNFKGWNTKSDGSGVSYVNGATYSFIAPVTLYAQWTATKHRAVTHRVTFDANGGKGTMAVQSKSVLTLLRTNAFTRSGYNFKGWNTRSKGSGTGYANRAAYSFAKSTTLYAQWTKKVTKKATIKVTFKANGGRGTMPDEIKTPAGLLVAGLFTRSGYNFKGWNTKPDGSGKNYANGAVYSFAKSITLYAQWTKKAS